MQRGRDQRSEIRGQRSGARRRMTNGRGKNTERRSQKGAGRGRGAKAQRLEISYSLLGGKKGEDTYPRKARMHTKGERALNRRKQRERRAEGREIEDWLLEIGRKEGGRHLPTKGTNAHERGTGIEQKKTKGTKGGGKGDWGFVIGDWEEEVSGRKEEWPMGTRKNPEDRTRESEGW